MSYLHIQQPPRARRRHLIVSLLAVGIALALVGAYFLTRPTPIDADGRVKSVRAGARVGDVRELPLWAAPPGDLLAIDGSVIATAGGEPPLLIVNGKAVPESERLYMGDRVVSRRGADVKEASRVAYEKIKFKTVYQGRGSLSELTTEGVPGTREVTVGLVSGIRIPGKVIRKPIDAVVVRHKPRPGQKLVALTFDDGPWPGQTDKILDILAKENVKATFFMVGVRVKRAPSLARRVSAEGHQVANHTMGHRDLARVSAKEVAKQIVKGRGTIKAYTKVDTPWLRPPYGSMDAAAWKVTKKTRSKVVLWNVDSEDWRRGGVSKIRTSVVKHTRPGSVILMHDGGIDRRQTITALPGIIRDLKKRGYVFVTVEDLYSVRAAAK